MLHFANKKKQDTAVERNDDSNLARKFVRLSPKKRMEEKERKLNGEYTMVATNECRMD